MDSRNRGGGASVWCNPPYSTLRPWVEKAWRECHDALIVMILPANRTEQRWWQELVEPWRDRGLGFSVRFLPGRIRFIAAGAEGIGKNERPPFGCVLLVWDNAKRPDNLHLEPETPRLL